MWWFCARCWKRQYYSNEYTLRHASNWVPRSPLSQSPAIKSIYVTYTQVLNIHSCMHVLYIVYTFNIIYFNSIFFSHQFSTFVFVFSLRFSSISINWPPWQPSCVAIFYIHTSCISFCFSLFLFLSVARSLLWWDIKIQLILEEQ